LPKSTASPTDRAHFHTLRHSCAVWLLEQDRDLLEIQDHLGHASITNTAIYARVSPVRRDRMAKDIEAGVTKRR
jgi:site-specific recombinase XerD